MYVVTNAVELRIIWVASFDTEAVHSKQDASVLID